MNKLITLCILLTFSLGCQNQTSEKDSKNRTDISQLENEIELRLREYETHLRNGDSISLGEMYMENAEIMPATAGRDDIIKVFSAMIKDSITNSSFKTVQVWGNDQLLVEEGTGTWAHVNGKVVGKGRYLLVWKKEDGEWKILRDTWFSDEK